MIKLILSLTIILLSIMMFFINHPLSMGIFILMQTLILCLLSSMMIHTYWFSYILFLTFLGGLLILFVYVSSVASNEIFQFSFNYNFLFMFFSLMLILLISLFFKNNLFWMNINFNYEMNNLFNLLLFFNNENMINLNKLYNNQNYLMMMMMIIYLFITLIAIVKITNIFFGPLRSFIN